MSGQLGGEVSPHGESATARPVEQRAATLVFALVLAAGIYVLRETQANPNEGVTLLYSIPIVLIAIRFGAFAGLLAALVSLGLFAVWELGSDDVDIGPLGYVTRGVAFLVLGGVVGGYATARRRLIERLQALARTDPLTGLLNHRAFYAELSRALALGRRHQRECSLLVVDLNGFKTINDQYGHVAGDEVLRRAADQLQSCVRGTDIVGRTGGDEFAMLLPETGASGAETAKARVVDLLAAVEVDLPDGTLRVGVSVGTATFDGSATVEPREALAHADSAMYAAKAEPSEPA